MALRVDRPDAVDDRSPTEDVGPVDAASTEDVEFELYSSAREPGWGFGGLVTFGPAPDDGPD